MLPRKSQPHAKRSHGSRAPDRALLLGGMLALWMMVLVGRLYFLEIIDYAVFVGRAQRQQQHTIDVAPQRGAVYDSRMHPLAMSLPVDSVYAVPAEIPNHEAAAQRLASALGIDPSDLVGRFKVFRSFCWVKRKVSFEEATRVRNLNLKGIYFQKEMKRFYPKGDLAAHVLGYVGLDDNGLAGLEFAMNHAVQGRPGHLLLDTDAHRQSFRSIESAGEPGETLILTLDENIQYLTETVLAKTVKKWHAAGGTIIVQDPNTGEILALANQPTFNPNDYLKSQPMAWENRGISWVYEPGSTFKLITVSAALEEGLIRPSDVIDCQEGRIVLAGHTIHDNEPFGALTVEQILVHSSDVGAIKIGLRLGEERFYRYIRKFGFGSRAGVELPGEERGLLKPPSHWSGISLGEVSMGQEIGVTPLQMVTAYSAIANGGILFQPRIVRDIFRGDVHGSLPLVQGRRVVSVHTAEMMSQMLMQVVEHGTGILAQLDGYTAAGKTGTAQKIDADGHYSHSHFVSSFVGFAPVEFPVITILVVIDTPVGGHYGQEVAAPAFRSIAEQTLGYLNVPQNNPTRWPQLASSAPAGYPRQIRGNPAGFLPSDAEPPGAAISPVERVSYRPDFRGPRRGTELLNEGPQISIPDFSGLSVRQVAEECGELGLDLYVAGSGLGQKQKPLAGSQVPAGATIWVQFGR